MKQGDFLRCIRYFGKMSHLWSQLATSGATEGHKAYAKKKSVIFREMERDTREKFIQAGYADRLDNEGKILADFVRVDRMLPENIIDYGIVSHLKISSLDGFLSTFLATCRIRCKIFEWDLSASRLQMLF